MIADKKFWELENDAPLLGKNAGYITPETAQKVIFRARKLLDLIEKQQPKNVKEEEEKDSYVELPPDMSRIFILDAERTFKAEENRKKMVKALTEIWKEVCDYHQGLGFVVAFLLLFFPPEDVVNIAITLNSKYTPGYFRAYAYEYFKDAKVHFKLLEKYFPLFAKHLEKNCISPEAYCSKLFVGLCVHVLPFNELLYFFECYFEKNYIFLFQFSLALVKVCENDLLSTNDVSRIFAILRLDESVYPLKHANYSSLEEKGNNFNNDNSKGLCNGKLKGEKESEKNEENKENEKSEGKEKSMRDTNFFNDIIDEALNFNISEETVKKLREEAAEEMRIAEEKKKQREAEMGYDSDDEIVFSDEEEENEKREAEEN